MGRSNSGGYVLLAEVLLGLTLVLIALLAVFQLFFTSDATVGLADRSAQANQIARRYLEEELLKDYDDVVPSTGDVQVVHAIRRGTTLRTTFTYTVEVVEPDPAKRIKDVSVTVEWGTRPRHRTTLSSAKGELW